MSNILSISDLKPGMVIVRITQQNGPVKIRKSGLVSSDAMVEGLAEMGVQEIEIDPDQTVEIAPASTASTGHRTQTQALLRGQHDTSAKFDKTLSDQFNRSLFLPTVQGLPSMWKVYTKEFAIYTLIVVGGLCIGFTLATRGVWWPSVTASIVQGIQVEEVSSVDTTEINKQVNTDAISQTLAGEAGADKPVEALENSAPLALSNTSTTHVDELVPSLNAEKTVNQNTDLRPTVAVNETEVESDSLAKAQTDTKQDSAPDSVFDEGKVLNSQENNNIEVSPELMARFNQAVASLDTKAQNDDFEPETKVTVRDSLQRVDQLPVRLLTRLPSMSFSAHMYASRADDRWVRVNGKQLSEGDWIDDKVQIVNIEAQRVVLGFEQELFTMAALTDW